MVQDQAVIDIVFRGKNTKKIKEDKCQVQELKADQQQFHGKFLTVCSQMSPTANKKSFGKQKKRKQFLELMKGHFERSKQTQNWQKCAVSQIPRT